MPSVVQLQFVRQRERWPEQLPILSQQFIQNYTSGRGNVQRMLETEHRDPNMRVAMVDESGRNTIFLVPEYETNRKSRNPVKEVDRADACFDYCKFSAAFAFAEGSISGIVGLLPADWSALLRGRSSGFRCEAVLP